nr:restriction endonuclease subunit S [Rhodoferax sp.]
VEKGVPEGWSLSASNEAFDILGGGTPNTDEPMFWTGPIPFFTPKDATANFYALNCEKNISEKGLNACSTQLFPKNTIFITARGTVGKLALAAVPMAMNQSCYALRPKHAVAVYFHYLAIRDSINYIKSVSKSGVFDNIVMDTFKNVPLLLPPQVLMDRFNEAVASLFIQVANLLERNRLLASTRDSLLPRLISGKLSVDALDIRFPPGMGESGT